MIGYEQVPVYTNAEEKMALYRVMRLNWKTKFDASGNELTDAVYTYEMLVRYMAAQEREERSQERASGRGIHEGRGGGRSSARSYAGRVRRPYQQGGPRAQRIRYQYEYGPRGKIGYK